VDFGVIARRVVRSEGQGLIEELLSVAERVREIVDRIGS